MYYYIDNIEDLKKTRQILLEYLNQEGSNKLAVDCETYWDQEDYEYWNKVLTRKKGKIAARAIRKDDGTYQGYPATIQIGTDCTDPSKLHADLQFIIDCRKLNYSLITRELKDILESAVILGHNLKYDYQYLIEFFDIDIGNKRIVDTMIISKVLMAGNKLVTHNLADCYARYIGGKNYALFMTEFGMSPDQYKSFKHDQQVADWSKPDLDETQLQYAADDVRHIFILFEILTEELDLWKKKHEHNIPSDKGLNKVIRLECALIPTIAMMELRGLKFDVQKHINETIKPLEKIAEESEKELNLTKTIVKTKSNRRKGENRITWEETEIVPVNLSSPIQVKQAIESIIKTECNFIATVKNTEEDTIKELGRLYPQAKHKLDLIIKYKKAKSLLSKFGEKLSNFCYKSSYIHPSWLQIGSDENAIDTGRSSCSNPNIQQQVSRGSFDGISLKKLFRNQFISEDGWDLIDADYKQIEARVAAEICGEYDLIDMFNNDPTADIYREIAKAMLDRDPSKEERDVIGKVVGLSLLYGTWWPQLIDYLYIHTEGKIDWRYCTEKGEQAYNNFFKNFKMFQSKMAECRQLVRLNPESKGKSLEYYKNLEPFAISTTVLGRIRRFCLKKEHLTLPEGSLRKEFKVLNRFKNYYEERISSAGREYFNFKIQGTAADILKIAAVLITKEFKKAGFSRYEGIIALLHDEVMCHVKKEHSEQAKQIVEDCMKRAGRMILKKVNLDVDINVGKSWYDAKH